MHLNQIFLLLDLEQTHSFNQTAERNFTTQQNVSYNIKQLEQELGIKIFKRSKTGVTFTKNGQHVLECARQIRDAHQELMHNLGCELNNDVPLPAIRLHISSVLLNDDLVNIIKLFNHAHPATRLLIREVDYPEILPALLNDECDMAFWSVNQGYLERNMTPEMFKHFTCHTFMSDDSVAVVSKQSKLAQEKSLSIATLTDFPKSIFGLMPIDSLGKNPDSSVLYENNNVAVHQHFLLTCDSICFTANTTYQQFFPSDKFVALPFDYPVLPVHHMLFRQKSAHHIAYDTLTNIITQQMLTHKI